LIIFDLFFSEKSVGRRGVKGIFINHLGSWEVDSLSNEIEIRLIVNVVVI
jgi:predicted acetyltransferase